MGASPIIDGTATGTVLAPESRLNPELVIGELADEVDRLNDRPDSSRPCWDAVLAYAAEPTSAPPPGASMPGASARRRPGGRADRRPGWGVMAALLRDKWLGRLLELVRSELVTREW
ncbi:hypothetical protein [Amycolatopsis sp. Hca4]|uniref:hypothetical protein n=1 Tax=Amycolatopsis sp. Hca4 TaxID=2742131 RepID=UPI0015922170|nr:hypothetical protein [Amycolatopsis sp. Hca4]QKV76189.1 hypothetical protein HUT10_22215 [Amycolatopsis sp. Hca4]